MTHQTGRHNLWTRWTLAASLVLLASGRTEAQYIGVPWGIGPFGGYGGFGGWSGYGGWGGWGGNLNYGGWGGYGAYGLGLGRYGMSPGMLNFYRMQAAARNASRYNLNNAEATTAYQAANLYRQAAVRSMLNNRMQAAQVYQGETGGAGVAPVARAPGRSRTQTPAAGEDPLTTGRGQPAARGETQAQAANRPATFGEMIAENGEVFWPLGAPDQGDLGTKRAAATRAIQDLMQQARAGGDVSVRRVVQARNALADYAVPAAQQLKDERPDDVDGFATYIKTLDAGLRSLALGETPGASASPRRTTTAPDIKPADAPESAGEILEKKIETKPR